MRVRFLNVNGRRTRCLFAGAGYPLLTLHGIGLSADTWLRNIDPLAQSYAIYAPDLPGHGFSSPIELQDGDLYGHLIEHLVGLVNTLGLDKFAVAGSSFGGLLAGLLYFRMPQRVEGIIIIGSGAAFNTEEEMQRVLPQVRKNGMASMLQPSLETCRARLANICYSPASVPEELLLIQLTSYGLPEVVQSYMQMLDAMMDPARSRPYRIRERLDQITVPTLIIWGRQDSRGIYERAIEASRRLPQCELVTLEKCGHLPFIEHPDRFNDLVGRFLQQFTPRGEKIDV